MEAVKDDTEAQASEESDEESFDSEESTSGLEGESEVAEGEESSDESLADSEEESFDDGELEETVGTTEVGKVCSEAMVALGRTARSFLLYEPDNKAIRTFLEDLREKMHTFLSRYGDMVLTVRPWEMLLGREVVYVNRDRERSLSFKLFRDGVRKVTIGRAVQWDELTKFLGIISIRYTGVRQQEDDIVTLLWKAGFQSIHIVAVEGFIPDDEDWTSDAAGQGGGIALQGTDQSSFFKGDRGFDMPFPKHSERGPLRFEAIPAEELAHLQDETTSVALPDITVRLLREILLAAANPADPMSLEEAKGTVDEVRDFLLSEGLLSHLLIVLKTIKELDFSKHDAQLQKDVIQGFSDVRALGRVIRSVPRGLSELPRDLLELVKAVPGDRVTILVDILTEERAAAARWAVRSLLIQLASDSVEYIIELIDHIEGPASGDLLMVVADLNMDRAFQVALKVDMKGHHELQLQALGIIERNSYSKDVATKLTMYMESDYLDVRLKATKLLVAQRERWAFMAFVQRLEKFESGGMEPREVEALAAAMGTIWGTRAMDQFQRWIKPKGLFRRVIPGQQTLKMAAVHGLSQIKDKKAGKYIQLVVKESSGELEAYAEECLVRHKELIGVGKNG